MKLLKLVPDHTNIDFMRWRNLAIILSTLLDGRVARLHRLSRPEPRDRFRRRPGRAGRVRPTGAHRRSAHAHRAAGRRRSEHPGARQRPDLSDPAPKPGRTRNCRQPRWSQAAGGDPAAVSGRPGRCGRIRLGQGQRGAGERGRQGDHLRDARNRDLHLVPVRMAIRRRGSADARARCVDDARFLCLHPPPGRSQRGRRAADHRRLFAERHGRHLRPNPRESAKIPQDGDSALAQPVIERDPGADGGHVADRADRARRADADRAGGHLRPGDRDFPGRADRHLFVDLHLGAGAGLARSHARTRSSRPTTRIRPKRSPPDPFSQGQGSTAHPMLGLPQAPR